MSKIEASLCLLAFAAIGSLLVSFLFLLSRVETAKILDEVLLNLRMLDGMTTVVILSVLIREYRDYPIARLITGNKILVIQAVSIEETAPQGDYKVKEGLK